MLQLAGEIGEGLIINLFPVSALPQILAAYRSGAARTGRDASGDEVVARLQVAVTDDVEGARNLVRAAFGAYVAAPVYNRFFDWVGFAEVAAEVAEAFARRDRQATARAMTDEFIDAITIIGPAEVCRKKIQEFVDAGVTTPVIAPLATSAEAITAVFEALAPARR